MAEEIGKKWNVPLGLNLAFVSFLLLIAAGAFCVSIFSLFILPLISGEGADLAAIQEYPSHPQLYIMNGYAQSVNADYSPYELNMSISTPALKDGDGLMLVAASNGRIADTYDCLKEFNDSSEYTGRSRIDCTFPIEYKYLGSNQYAIYALLKRGDGTSYLSAPAASSFAWGDYEATFWGAALFILLLGFCGLLLCAAVMAAMVYISWKGRHTVEYGGEYSLGSLLSPLDLVKNTVKNPRSFLMSPFMWAIQLGGIAVLLFYMFLSSHAWESASATFSFFISGIFAFIVPFLITAAVWFSEYKEREPIRVIVSLFLWGGLCCILAIGLNSTADLLLGALSLGALTAFLIAPVVEESFKGTGLALFSLHHEYDDVADGIVYGFAIGMGFAFIENWLYLMNSPIGGNIIGWAALWFLRSIVFAANHGVFTAFTGAVIGYLKSRRFAYAPFGYFIGVLPAMLMHAIHNSGEIWQAICPFGGLLYLFIIAPLFDYGGLVVLMLLMIGWVIFMQGKKK